MLWAFLWDFLSWLTGLFRKRNIKILLELIHRKCCQQHYQSLETLLICHTCTTTKKTVKWFFRSLNQMQYMNDRKILYVLYSKFVPYACIHHLVIHLLSVVHYCLQMVFLNHLIDYKLPLKSGDTSWTPFCLMLSFYILCARSFIITSVFYLIYLLLDFIEIFMADSILFHLFFNNIGENHTSSFI